MELNVAVHDLDIPPSLSLPSLEALSARLTTLAGGVAVARGSKDVFCTGLDFATLYGADPGLVVPALNRFADCLLQFCTVQVPVIGVVRGMAAGAGMAIASACDVVIAASTARFALPEALFGFYPAMIIPVLEQRLSRGQIRRLALSCESIDAREALAIGLVDQVVEAAALEDAVRHQIHVLSRAQHRAVRGLKLHPAWADSLRVAVLAGWASTSASLLDPTVRQSARRFLEDGVAPWLDPS